MFSSFTYFRWCWLHRSDWVSWLYFFFLFHIFFKKIIIEHHLHIADTCKVHPWTHRRPRNREFALPCNAILLMLLSVASNRTAWQFTNAIRRIQRDREKKVPAVTWKERRGHKTARFFTNSKPFRPDYRMCNYRWVSEGTICIKFTPRIRNSIWWRTQRESTQKDQHEPNNTVSKNLVTL